LERLRYLSQIITHRLDVGEIKRAFEAFFFGRETGKVIIEQ
jgi:threonine dehydrogenase-like Zn-dependent dehydrogenase